MIRKSAVFLLLVAPALAKDWPLPSDRTGLMYVAGAGSNNVGEYLPNGTLLRTITHPTMLQPQGIAIDPQGNLIIVCQSVSRILRVDLTGTLIQSVLNANLTLGSGIARSPNGNWYVGNYLPGRVLVFDSNWFFQTALQPTGMDGVNSIAFDPNGDFAVSAGIANKIYRFSANHTFQGVVTDPQLAAPMGIANDTAGYHYVSCQNSSSVLKFSPSWSFVSTFTAPSMSNPQAIAVDDNGILAVTSFLNLTVNRFDTNGTMVGSFPLLGVTSGRSAAYQTSTKILARAGTVDAANGYPDKILSVNGQVGNALGKVTVIGTQPLTVNLAAPATGPNPANFVLYAHMGEPGTADVQTLPYNIGLISFELPSSGGASVVIANTIGYALGFPIVSSPPAPTAVFSLPAGPGSAGTLTIQGLIYDNGSESVGPLTHFSVTNALVITIN